jgi:hypothetical protein
MNKKLRTAVGMVMLAMVLGGCSSTPLVAPGDGGKVVTPTEVLGQSALPAGAVLKAEQSLIMGAGEQWVGRVVADVGRDTDIAYRFFLESYPAQGWALVSAVRGKTSLIVLTRQDRTATVELTEGSLLSSGVVVLTVSPRNAQVSAPRR